MDRIMIALLLVHMESAVVLAAAVAEEDTALEVVV
jgi:hypothetical protein